MKPIVESHSISIPVSGGMINGDMNIPLDSRATVLFAHGSGSSRHSLRNRYVARILNESGMSTLLLDLLTVREEEEDRSTSHLRFDISLLADRLVGATDWLTLRQTPEVQHIGYFGASTGAAAALVAAAKRPEMIEAVVSRGGRPDLAGSSLWAVRAPTLLIVGEYDGDVIDLNFAAAAELQTEHRIQIIPRAGHLFEEPGTLEQAAYVARLWFEDRLMRNRIDAA